MTGEGKITTHVHSNLYTEKYVIIKYSIMKCVSPAVHIILFKRCAGDHSSNWRATDSSKASDYARKQSTLVSQMRNLFPVTIGRK